MSLLTYFLRRIAFLPLVLLAASFLVYAAVILLPGDPVTAILGEEYDPRVADELRSQLGLGKPVVVGYAEWLVRVVRGDLGRSVVLSTRTPVIALLWQRLPATLELSVFAMLWALGMGIPLGIWAALRRNTSIDLGVSIASLTGISIPVFFRGILLILFLAVYTRIFPSGGYVDFIANPIQNLRLMFLPSIGLGFGLAGVIVRFTRTSMLDVLDKEYITTARAKGLLQNVILYKHALRNALAPVVTVAGLQFGAIIGGVVITEILFSVPGMGSLLVEAIYQRDYPVVQGVALFVTGAFVFTNLLVDMLYTLIDPRLRYGT